MNIASEEFIISFFQQQRYDEEKFFSPIVAVAFVIVSVKVPSAVAQARAASTSAGLLETNKVCTVSNNSQELFVFSQRSQFQS